MIEPTTGGLGAGRRRSGADLGALARGGSLTLLGSVVSAGVNLLLVLVVARGTDQVTAGIFFSLTSLFVLTEILCRLGADVGLVYFVARWLALDDRDRLRPGLRGALGPACWLGLGLAVVAVALAGPIAALVGAPGWEGAVRLLGVMLPVAAAYDLTLAVTRGFGRMGPTALIERIVRPSAQLLLVGTALALGLTSFLVAAWVLPYLAVAGLAWFAFRSLPWPGGVLRRASFRRETRRTFWRFSGPRAVASAAQVALQRFDILLVAAILGPSSAALYTAATRFLVVGQLVNQALSGPVQPQLSAVLARRDLAGAARIYQSSTAWLILAVWPLLLLAAVFAPAYLALFGPGYESGVSTVVTLSLAMLVATGCGLVDTVLLMAGRATWNLATTALALAVNVGVDLLLIPRYGVIGAAFGWAAAILVANLVPLAVLHGSLRLVMEQRQGHAPDLAAGEEIQHAVPDGTVQASRAA